MKKFSLPSEEEYYAMQTKYEKQIEEQENSLSSDADLTLFDF